MKLIKKIGLKFSRGANRSHAIFECEECNTKTTRELGLGIKAKSCGCFNKVKIINNKINGVEIVREIDKISGRRAVEYICPSCKQKKEKLIGSLMAGRKTCRACGLLKMQKSRIKYHSKEEANLATIHSGILQRCYNKNSIAYKSYGMRGIKVSKKWRENKSEFVRWGMINGFKCGMSIDRIDNSKGYSEENCRIATIEMQMQNTRLLRSTNTSGYRGVSIVPSGRYKAVIDFNGKTYRLGTFDTQKEAAMAYDEFVTRHKTCHPTNFPPLGENITREY